ncbi:helix-turn-helix domain-containing protein [Variovorax ginsengisoli]|uniref:AraC-like DNA-binding protein n=1 Tax=Variovorax ginsengisoli TaxID=363844 RepID=A0ABT9SDQ4_9BURK|nr:helix-turn-helix domain-containing protein [Variovorax ginsengisoli]MDP9902014.1 AraC-like DNA-binding protein [Variovorax ginsengisoli]
MKLQYSTEIVETPRRFDYWNEVVCRHCLLADSKTLSESRFDGKLEVRTAGTVGVSTLSAPLHHWRRDAHHIRVGPDDDLWLAFMVRGEARISQDGREAHLRSGDMAVYDATRPFEFDMAPEKVCVVRLPRKSMLSRVPTADRVTAQLIDPRRPGGAAVRSMIEEAASTEFSDADAAARYGSALLDVLALHLDIPSDAKTVVRERDLHARLVAYIRENFADTGLTLQALAQTHHVSERTVARAFARHNQTPMEVLRRARLQASHRALAERQADSVTTAALSCGFTDLSHFSRVFRLAYGYTPQSLLSH